MHRPLLSLSAKELKSYHQKNTDIPANLLILLHELTFRESSYAPALSREVITTLFGTMKKKFSWPSTQAAPGEKPLTETPWPQIGMLSKVGYRVGKSGKKPSTRRALLDHLYSQTLPKVNSPQYVAEWGSPRSAKRLQKLANVIATQTRNTKRQNNPSYQKAIRDWESDLGYLKKAYYDGVYDFGWPNTLSRKKGKAGARQAARR